jgi:hypothetical protein
MKKLLFLYTTALIFGIVSVASAVPIDFNVAGGAGGSSVDLSIIDTWGNTSISANLVANLDNEIFSLNDGESHTFDVFDIKVDGFGLGKADVLMILAFDSPSGSETTVTGVSGWFTFFNLFSGLSLKWNDTPSSIILSNGNSFDVFFKNICTFGCGDSFTIAATVTAHTVPGPGPDPNPTSPVPEPATILLMGVGLIGLAGYSRKKFNKKL